ncbi:MAG: universal stress protein [Pirellulales bacterium]|nr:universal stress protein [Planctomycetales bacterium]
MRVLIAVDGSGDGFAAARQIGQLLAPERDQIGVFYSPPEVHVGAGSAPDGAIIDRARQALSDSVFDEAAERLPDGFHAALERITGHGQPRRAILKAADEWKADMIVVGARGLGPIQQALLGSVSLSVAHSAKVPVFVARDATTRAGGEGYRVLVAFDESEVSEHAVVVMTGLTFPGHTVGRVVTVIESMFAGEVPEWLEQQARDADSEAMAQAWVREHDQERQHARDMLVSLIARLPGGFGGHEPIVAEGHPSQRILETIRDEQIDLVVLGAHGRGMIDRLLVGSTSEKVLAHAPCSVLIVRE